MFKPLLTQILTKPATEKTEGSGSAKGRKTDTLALILGSFVQLKSGKLFTWETSSKPEDLWGLLLSSEFDAR